MPGIGRVELGASGPSGSLRQQGRSIIGSPGAHAGQGRQPYSKATGLPPMLPEWASGLWQSSCDTGLRKSCWRWPGSTRGVVRPCRLSLSILHWTRQGEWKFDPAEWPDPQAMVDELKELGVELCLGLASINPDSENYGEIDRRGLWSATYARCRSICRSGTRAAIARSSYGHRLDQPRSTQLCVGKGQTGVGRYGIRAFWLDAYGPQCYQKMPRAICFNSAQGPNPVCNVSPGAPLAVSLRDCGPAGGRSGQPSAGPRRREARGTEPRFGPVVI